MPLNQPPSFKQRKLKKLIEHVQSLLVVFLMIAATAVMWSGKFLGHEIGTPRNSSAQATSKVAQPTKEQLQKLNIAANATLVVRDSASWTITAANGNAQGVVISTALYAKDVKGFAGPTPLYIYVDTQGVVKNIIAADNAETASFFDRAFSQLIPQWTGKRTSEASTLQVDAVTGATFSSRALIANVQQTLAAQNAAAQKATIRKSPRLAGDARLPYFCVTNRCTYQHHVSRTQNITHGATSAQCGGVRLLVWTIFIALSFAWLGGKWSRPYCVHPHPLDACHCRNHAFLPSQTPLLFVDMSTRQFTRISITLTLPQSALLAQGV